MLVLDLLVRGPGGSEEAIQKLLSTAKAAQHAAPHLDGLEGMLGPAGRRVVLQAGNQVSRQEGRLSEVVPLLCDCSIPRYGPCCPRQGHCRHPIHPLLAQAMELTCERKAKMVDLAPVLSLAYPRCLLAGASSCPLTLSLSKLPPCPVVKVFARHQGRFLGSKQEEGFRTSLACSTLCVPGPFACSHGSETDLYITLDAPPIAGLISIECEGDLLSNWKPVRQLP